MLVSALAERECTLRAYREAIKECYRFPPTETAC
jgi:S-adenosylmethionine:tRNA-ribosyltransferase-isomerase (queuine synthetase)